MVASLLSLVRFEQYISNKIKQSLKRFKLLVAFLIPNDHDLTHIRGINFSKLIVYLGKKPPSVVQGRH